LLLLLTTKLKIKVDSFILKIRSKVLG